MYGFGVLDRSGVPINVYEAAATDDEARAETSADG